METQITEIKNVDELRKPVREEMNKQLEKYKQILHKAQNYIIKEIKK